MSTSTEPTSGHPNVTTIPAPGVVPLVGIELRKSVDTLTGKWLLGIMALLVVGALAVIVTQTDRAEWSFLPFLSVAVIPLSLFLPILGVLLVSGEFSQRTMLTTLALVPSRSRFVLTKTLAAVVLAFIGALVAVVLTAAATGIAGVIEPGTSWAVEWVVLGQLLMTQVLYVLIGVAFGLLCQNTPLAVVAYLIIPSILTPLLFIVPSLAEVGAWLDLNTATAPLLFLEPLTADQWAKVGTTTAIWFGIPFVLGWLRLSRRDIA